MGAKASSLASPRWRAVLVLAVLGVALFALSGCGEVKEEIWLKGNNQWKVDLTLILNASERSMLGNDFDQRLDQAAKEAKGQGASFRWSKRNTSDGGSAYTMTAEGQGWDTLNEVAFSKDASLSKDAKGNVRLNWNVSSLTGLRSYTLTIHGGKVVSSNADEETSNSATWRNPRQVNVVMIEPSAFNWLLLVVGLGCLCTLGAIVIGAVIAFVLLRRKKPAPQAAGQADVAPPQSEHHP